MTCERWQVNAAWQRCQVINIRDEDHGTGHVQRTVQMETSSRQSERAHCLSHIAQTAKGNPVNQSSLATLCGGTVKLTEMESACETPFQNPTACLDQRPAGRTWQATTKTQRNKVPLC